MFREGYYLEIIKVKHSAATAVITVKEKTVNVKQKRIKSNKWLTLEDWSSLYEILEKALLQNIEKKLRSTEKKKFTKHLEIGYTFEASENPSDRTSLPTIRVSVSSLKKEKKKKTSVHNKSSSSNNNNNNNNNDNDRNNGTKSNKRKNNDKLSNDEISKTDEIIPLGCKSDYKVEEYIPDTPNTNKIDNSKSICKIGYVPSRKSTLELLQQRSSNHSNEYVPSLLRDETISATGALDDLYIPNSIPKSGYNIDETYEPSSLMTCTKSAGEYIPNSKGVKKARVEEYQPDFIVRNKTMKFDNSYIPSSSQKIKELKKNDKKTSKNDENKKNNNKESERINKESSNAIKRNSNSGHGKVKREM